MIWIQVLNDSTSRWQAPDQTSCKISQGALHKLPFPHSTRPPQRHQDINEAGRPWSETRRRGWGGESREPDQHDEATPKKDFVGVRTPKIELDAYLDLALIESYSVLHAPAHGPWIEVWTVQWGCGATPDNGPAAQNYSGRQHLRE
jgi:hypothetical protein